MKVLIIGYGSMGRRHAANAAASGHDVAVYDPALSAVPAADDVKGFRCRTEQDAWDWGPSAIVVASPASTHVRWLWEASSRADAVFVEKPLGLSIADLSRDGVSFAEAYAMAGHQVRIQVGCNWRFHPLVCEFRRRLTEAHGMARQAIFWIQADDRTWPGQGYADTLLEMGAHEIDLALWFFGPATLASAERLRDGTAWRIALRHAAGSTSTVVLDGRAAKPSRGLRVQWDGWDGGYDVPAADPRTPEALAVSYARELRYFLDTAAGLVPPDYEGSPRPATLADGMAVLRIIDEVRRMAC